MQTSQAAPNFPVGFGLPYWLDLPRPRFDAIDEDIDTDALVIGAGIFGLKVAHYLSQQGVGCIILDAGQVGDGASGRNQGSVNHSGSMSYSDAIHRYGRERARAIWQLGLENHRLIREQLEEYKVDCSYRVAGCYFLARRDIPDCEANLIAFRRDYDLLHEDGFAVDHIDDADALRATGNGVFAGGVKYLTDAQFHSGQYVIGLAQGVARQASVRLFENSRVSGIERRGDITEVRVGGRTVRASLVFMGLNALAPQWVPFLDSALRAERGQVLVTEPLPDRPCTGSFGTAMAWWREIEEPDGRFRLLFGGGRVRDEPDSLFHQFTADGRPNNKLETDGFSPSLAHQHRLDRQFGLLFPQYRKMGISHRWGGLQSFTADGFPEVGLFDEERRIYGAAGFCGRGNCYSDVAAAYVTSLALRRSALLDKRYCTVVEQMMQVGRSAAAWGPWASAVDNTSV